MSKDLVIVRRKKPVMWDLSEDWVRSICKWSGDDLLRQQNKKIKIMMVGWSVSMYYVMTQDHVGRVCVRVFIWHGRLDNGLINQYLTTKWEPPGPSLMASTTQQPVLGIVMLSVSDTNWYVIKYKIICKHYCVRVGVSVNPTNIMHKKKAYLNWTLGIETLDLGEPEGRWLSILAMNRCN